MIDRNSEQALEALAKKVVERFRHTFSYIDIDSISSDEDWVEVFRDIISMSKVVEKEMEANGA